MEVNNQDQLDLYIRNVLREALERTMEELLDKLYKIIDKDVYGWQSRSSDPWESNRTFQFRDSWERRKTQETKSLIKSEISQRITTMGLKTINGVKIHQDRNNLAQIINDNLFDNYQFGDVSPSNPKEPFWDEFEAYCKVNFETTFEKHCRDLGLDI